MSRVPALLMSPVVLAQARALRRRIPRLPPAAPTVSPSHGVGLLVVGDSTAVGVGVDDMSDALPGRIAGALGGMPWRVVGRSGATAADVRADLLGAITAERAQVAVLCIGWNDAMRLRSPGAFGDDLDVLLAALATTADRVVLVTPPRFGGFAVLPQPLRAALRASARGLSQEARRRADARGIPVAAGFDGERVAVDGFHPDAAGYARLAAGVIRALA